MKLILLAALLMLGLEGCAPWTVRVCQGAYCDEEPPAPQRPVIVKRLR